MRKLFFLVLTLAIPVIIFLFLKIFGKNTFEVPVLFEEGIPGCTTDAAPHVVSDFKYIGETEKNLNSSAITGHLIFGVLDGADIESNRAKLIEIVRIQDAFFETGSPKLVLLNTGQLSSVSKLSQLCEEIGLEAENRVLAFLPKEELDDFMNCGIGLIDASDKRNHLVLVDPERRIRGIYKYNDVEQTDQLILELRILKKMM